MTIWTYWHQGLDNAPPWVRLGRTTIERHAGGLDVVTLDASSIRRYLGRIPAELEQISSVATRVDYLRVHLLERFGGIWLDLDIAAFPALETLSTLLDEHELVSAGLHDRDITLAFMAARPHGQILGAWTELQARALRDHGPEGLQSWAVLGSALIADRVAATGYHMVDAARVYQLRWREWPRFLSPIADERPLLSADPFVVCFFHHQMGPRMARYSEEQLLSGHAMISRIYRRSFDLEDPAVDPLLRAAHPLDDLRWWLEPRIRPRLRRLKRGPLSVP